MEGKESKEEVKKENPIEPIYSGGLSQEAISKKKILQPIAEENINFIDLQKQINKVDYKKFKEDIDKRIEAQPKHSKTFMGSEIKRFINNFEQLSFLLKQQQRIFIKAINDMVNLSKIKK